MRILITTPSYPPASGGVACVSRRQAEYLAGEGHEVTVVTGSSTGMAMAPSSQSGVTLIRLPIKTGRFPAYAAGDRLGIRQPDQRLRYQEMLLQFDSDVLVSHCWQAWNTDWALDISDRLRFPFCLYSHGTSVNDTSGKTGWLRWLRWRPYALGRMPRALRNISLLISLDAQADRNRFYDVTLARKLGANTAVIANCANSYLQHAGPWQPSGFATRYLALSVGQYNDQKNPTQVMNTFLRRAPPDWTLVLCGSERTPYLTALEATYASACRNGPAPAVHFLTALPERELMGLYKRADLFLTASRTECQPLVILDAIAAGVPYVSTDVGCVRSLPGGSVGRTAAEFESLAATLMRDPELRARHAADGRRAHQETYNCAATLQRLGEVLARVVESNRLHE